MKSRAVLLLRLTALTAGSRSTLQSNQTFQQNTTIRSFIPQRCSSVGDPVAPNCPDGFAEELLGLEQAAPRLQHQPVQLVQQPGQHGDHLLPAPASRLHPGSLQQNALHSWCSSCADLHDPGEEVGEPGLDGVALLALAAVPAHPELGPPVRPAGTACYAAPHRLHRLGQPRPRRQVRLARRAAAAEPAPVSSHYYFPIIRG